MAKIIDPRIWASTELVEKRKKICDECEHKKYILHNYGVNYIFFT